MTEIDSILKDAQSVAVSGHVRPDGDCVGSTLAVYNYIKDYYPDIKARLYLEPSPNIFKFMQRADEIIMLQTGPLQTQITSFRMRARPVSLCLNFCRRSVSQYR